MVFAFGDVGAIGDEKDPIFEQKIYSSLGLGVRASNPDLVLPTFELRFGVLQNVEVSSFGIAFNLGNLAYPEIRIPGVRPGTLRYD
jgi:hypothetical protein